MRVSALFRLGRLWRQRTGRVGILLLGLLVVSLALSVGTLHAQPTSTRVELAAERPADNLLLHVRVLRGQTVDAATFTTEDTEIELTPSPVELPVTQWVVLDASDAMVNLQSAVLGGVQNFLRSREAPTGVIIYDSEVRVLQPTDRQSEIDNFLAEYTATADEPGCAADALYEIASQPRDPERSLRILHVTGGLSRQTACVREGFAPMPAPVDVVAVTDSVSDPLQEMVERSGGDIFRANLRTVEARLSEVSTLWGQPSYALRGEFSNDVPDRGTLSLTLSNGIEEDVAVRVREYDFPAPIEPTATATDIILATIPPRETDTPPPTATDAEGAAAGAPLPTENPPTAGAAEPPPPTEDDGGTDNSIVILLIAGAVLFVVGAIVLALALANMRRRPPQTVTDPATNFYDTLDDDETGNEVNTRIGTRDIVSDDDVGVTRMSDMRAGDPTSPGTKPLDDPDETTILEDIEEEANAEDDMLVTKMLSDESFQKMMQQSKEEDEIVGWLRLESVESSGDYELRRRGALVGRSQECDIQIRGDSVISRKHVRFDVHEGDKVTIVRESMTNPVVVGGVTVVNRYPLESNDVIHMSDKTRLIFIRRDDDDSNPPDDPSGGDDFDPARTKV